MLATNTALMKVHFLGAAGEVTGSCFLVEIGEVRVLIDCGLFQGTHEADSRSQAEFDFDPTKLSAVIVTHAHIDHCGRVPLLFARGYRGPVYATEPTGELMELQWDDMLHIMQERERRSQMPPSYDASDVARAAAAIIPMPYGRRMGIVKDVEFIFHDAGHILGSSFVELHAGGRTAVFSGDIGNDNVPIVRETEALVPCDLLVTEATYGDRTHAATAVRRNELRRVIIDAIKRGGTLMIAAFSLERTQEILFELDQLIEKDHALPRIPIFLDSPLAIKANEVFRKYTGYYDEVAAAEWRAGNDFFQFPGLTVTTSVQDSKKINEVPGPKIVIAGSGMLAGGRIVHHLMRYLSDPKSTLLFVSYQAEGTLGRKIQDRAFGVTINGEQIPLRCAIDKIGSYSAHGDQEKLLRWMRSGRSLPGRVVVVHADPPAAAEFCRLAAGQGQKNIEAAVRGQAVEI